MAAKDATVHMESALLNGTPYQRYSFALPRFIEGIDKPLDFGGFWIQVASGGKASFFVEFEDQGRRYPAQKIVLNTVHLPKRHSTPRKIRTVAFDAQDWRQSFAQRLENLPRQFALMGLNTWSDYGLYGTTAVTGTTALSPEDMVRHEACRHFGVTEFWPNFSSLLQTDNTAHAPRPSNRSGDWQPQNPNQYHAACAPMPR